MKHLLISLAIMVALFSCSKQELINPKELTKATVKIEIPKETVATEDTEDSEAWPGGMGYPCPIRKCEWQRTDGIGCVYWALMCTRYCALHS